MDSIKIVSLSFVLLLQALFVYSDFVELKLGVLNNVQCGAVNGWSFVDIRNILNDSKQNLVGLQATGFSCASVNLDLFNGILDVTVYFENASDGSRIEIILSENDAPILNYVYRKDNKDFEEGWHTISLPIVKTIKANVLLLGFSQKNSIVIIESIQFRANKFLSTVPNEDDQMLQLADNENKETSTDIADISLLEINPRMKGKTVFDEENEINLDQIRKHRNEFLSTVPNEDAQMLQLADKVNKETSTDIADISLLEINPRMKGKTVFDEENEINLDQIRKHRNEFLSTVPNEDSQMLQLADKVNKETSTVIADMSLLEINPRMKGKTDFDEGNEINLDQIRKHRNYGYVDIPREVQFINIVSKERFTDDHMRSLKNKKTKTLDFLERSGIVEGNADAKESRERITNASFYARNDDGEEENAGITTTGASTYGDGDGSEENGGVTTTSASTDGDGGGGEGNGGVTTTAAPTDPDGEGEGNGGVTTTSAPTDGDGEGEGNGGVTTTAAPTGGDGEEEGNGGVTTTAAPTGGDGEGEGNGGITTTAAPTDGDGEEEGNIGVTTTAASTDGDGEEDGNGGVTTTAASTDGDGEGEGNVGVTTTAAATDGEGDGDGLGTTTVDSGFSTDPPPAPTTAPVTERPSFWNVYTIVLVSVGSVTIAAIVVVGAYCLGKNRGRGNVPPMDLSDFEAPRIIPRVRNARPLYERFGSEYENSTFSKD